MDYSTHMSEIELNYGEIPEEVVLNYIQGTYVDLLQSKIILGHSQKRMRNIVLQLEFVVILNFISSLEKTKRTRLLQAIQSIKFEYCGAACDPFQTSARRWCIPVIILECRVEIKI